MRYNSKESGKRIAALRKQAGLTQEQLANQLNIGTSTLGKIEIGYISISIEILIELSFFFKVSFEHILFGMEPEELFGQNESTRTKMKLLIEQLYDLGKEL